MGSRILTMKRQAAELGRIRTGYSRPNPNGGRPIPVRSKTFILSTHSRDYAVAASKLYGGTVETWTPQGTTIPQHRVITEAAELRAILPAGDPLSQANEMWTGGGCARRCDGETEQLSRQPCICLARYGEDWHLRKPDEVCRPTSRITVMLPDLPDLGVWRLETKSYYAADAMAGGVDTVLQATEGRGLMPVRMWIEQRSAVRNGQTKNYPVVMVVPSLPTLRQALSGPLSTAAALDPAGAARAAIEAPRPDYVAEARQCKTVADARQVWHRANRAGHVARDGSDPLSQELAKIADDIGKGIDTRTDEPGPDDDGVYEGEVVGDDEPPAAWPEVAAPGTGARS